MREVLSIPTLCPQDEVSDAALQRAALDAQSQALAQQLHAGLVKQEVARITAELAARHRHEVEILARQERARRSAVIAQLTGSIAHDFNNLLMVIGGSAQLMTMQMAPGDQMLRHVEKINATVAAAARLTAQLAAFSGTQRLDAQPLLIDDVIAAAIAEQRAVLPATIVFEQQLDAADAWVLGDRSQLQLAIGHLLRNAGDALAPHGRLRVHSHISPSSSIDGNDRIQLCVQDDGCGMTAEVLARATEPFFTTKPSARHPGLGLAQVSSVVQQAGGSLQLQSTPGEGTRVDICLPRHLPSVLALRPDPLAGRVTLDGAGRRRVLVIDDDDDVRAVIAEILRSLDYEVSEAHDGESGLRTLHETRPALAIVDFLMPGMHGGELARKMRQQYPALPILFISGYADSDAIAAIPHAQLLRKPILPHALELAVRAALAQDVAVTQAR